MAPTLEDDNGAKSTPGTSKSEVQPKTVNSISVKVPAFWPDEPALWFAQLEGQFALAGITVDATKYNYVISNLEYKYVTEIKDIVKNPPATGKYEKVRSELTTRLSASKEQRVRQLLSHEDVGERKPSQFLRHLQSLAGPNMPEDFVRSLWSSRLPTHIQVIVASQPRSSLDELATLADTVNDVIGQPQVHQVSAASSNIEVNDLKQCIAELTREVAALKSASRSRSRSRSQGRAFGWRCRSRSRSYDAATQGQCWYHRKYKANATKCRQPCTYTENEKGSH